MVELKDKYGNKILYDNKRLSISICGDENPIVQTVLDRLEMICLFSAIAIDLGLTSEEIKATNEKIYARNK